MIHNESIQPLSLYYDGLCPLCSKEMDMYRRHPKNQRLRFVDIAHPNFNASEEGLDPNLVHEKFHVKTGADEVIIGVDAFVKIWETLEMWPLMQSLAKASLSRPFFNLGYIVFAKIRPFFRRDEECTDYCQKNF